MKKIIFTLLISSFVTSFYSQNHDKIVRGPNSGSSETEEVTKKQERIFPHTYPMKIQIIKFEAFNENSSITT